MKNRILAATWLFLVGSILLAIDAISEIATHFSLAALMHLSEGVLFFVGSLLFMPVQDAEIDSNCQGE